MSIFHDRFNILFDESKLSQEEFGKLFGASKSQIFNWRNGRGEPDSDMMKIIADKCNVSGSWLIGQSDIRTPEKYDSIEKDWPEVTRVLRRAGRRPTEAERRRIAKIIELSIDADDV